MFERLKNGWRLAKATRKLVFKDRSLLKFPIIAFVVSIIEMIAIFIPIFFISLSSSSAVSEVLIIISLLAFYILVTFTSTYIIMAMFISFRSFLSGKKISFGSAFSQVKPYWKLILEWSAFLSVIIMVLRIIESRLGSLGRILNLISSMAISLATLFVVPVILDNKLTPIAAMKRSTKFIIDHFGATFGGLVYTDLYSLAIVFGGLALLIGGLALISISLVFGAVVALAGFIIMIGGGMLLYLLSNIFRLILYDFANYNKVPPGFSADLLQSSIKNKKSGISGFVPGQI